MSRFNSALGVISFIFFLCFHTAAQQGVAAKKVIKLMGCRFELTAVAVTDTLAWEAISVGIAEIRRIEHLISSWDPNSQTTQINQFAGIREVPVDTELYDLIFRAKKVSQLTEGAFDISFASMDQIWEFNRLEQKLPDPERVKRASAKIGWRNIQLDAEKQSVFLAEKGMKIGFGGIGKGYAANRAKLLMSRIDGVYGGVVNASGDLLAWGNNDEGGPWRIQIANPANKETAIGWLAVDDMAIVTSGDYEKYFLSDGQRFGHIINPKSGYPTTGITSVTVICPDAELADALATSIFVLGASKGLDLINRLKGVECLLITDGNDILTSTHLQLNYHK